MKSVISLLLVCLCINFSMAGKIKELKDEWDVPEHYKRPAKILHRICLAESGADEEIIKQCMDGTLHDQREVKCYIYCLFHKVDVIDEATGRILLDRLAPLAPNSDMRDAFEHLTRECGHIETDDPCDTAYEVAKCYFAAHDEVMRFCHLLMADVTN
ncbi:pheromone-binding protein-related protein 6 [Toxorhynchites rutilus septentrionalis]|uniref:pheromone-binding protein-related protein 6 n=1 Tax=Toxorhynchites rutilus septentrionalis TaxID=329112 RepID=UPI00247A3102|nr:pheromone-binding protein-related protein 6 [Toxorhynchites rutilus septentrionalis]